MSGLQETEHKTESFLQPSTAKDEIAGARPSASTNYGSLLRAFALRLCVAVTLGLVLLTVVEMYSYWRGTENQRALEPEVEATISQGTPEEREYWREQKAAQKVQYEPYVLWRRSTRMVSGRLFTPIATLGPSRCGCLGTPSCGGGAVRTPRPFHPW
jgi:hypothetical protein